MGGPQKHMSCINRWKHGWTGRWVSRWMGDGRVDGWVGRWVRLDWAGSKALSDDGIYLQRSVSFTAFSVQRLALARPPALAAPCLLHVRPPGPVPALSPVTLTWRSVFSRHAATEQKGAETASATLPSQGDRWLQSCVPCPGVSIKQRRRSRSWRSTAPTGVSTAPRCLVNRDALCPGVCPSQLPSVVRVGGHHMT